MTNDFKPIGFKKAPFIPKTETRIFLGGRPIDQQTGQTGSKGISKQHYQSERANEISPSYGPCDVCNKPVKTVEFYMGCPSCSDSTPGNWHHIKSGCENSRLLITNRGYLSCGGCGIGYNMSYWRFRCSNHPGDPRSMNEDCWNESMARALMLTTANSAIQELSMYVACHKKEFGFKE